MEMVSTQQAAEMLGVSVRRWHYLTDVHSLTPAMKMNGVRGAKLWNVSDVRKLAAVLASEVAS